MAFLNLKSQISNLKSQISNLKSQISNLKSQIENRKPKKAPGSMGLSGASEGGTSGRRFKVD
jgi:phage shock protein A